MKRFISLTILIVLTVTLLLTGCRGQKAVQSIAFTEGFKTEYIIGETPDFTQAKAIITYNDGSTENVEASQLSFGDLDTSTAGKKDVTVGYKGFITTFEVTVKDKTLGNTRSVESISYLSGINTSVFVGDTINFDKIKILVKYDNGTEETQEVATNTNIKHNGGSIDTAKVGEQTLTITYMGKKVDVVINVQAIVLQSIEVDGDTVDTTIIEGTNFDPTGMVVYANYNNGARLKLNFEDLTIVQNGTTVTVTYKDKSCEIKLSTTPPEVVSMIIKTTGYEATGNKIILGDKIDTTGVTATATLNNGTSKTIANSSLSFTGAVATEAGELKILATYVDNTSITAEYTIQVLGIEKIVIDTKTVNIEHPVGTEFNASNLSVLITLTDGSIVERSVLDGVSVDLSKLNVDVINMDDCYITASYGGTTSEKLQIFVIDPDINYFLVDVDMPASLSGLDSKKNLFLNGDYGYFVGDDNPFIFKLSLTILNDKDELIEGYSSYVSYFDIILDGVSLAGAELDKYVIINAEGNSLDFTDEAIGKTFTIKTRPLHGVDGLESEMTRELVVTVVDGYNVYEAWELNYLTNHNEAPISNWLSGESRSLLQIVDDFLKTKNAQRPTNLAGMVIHNDLIIKTTDIPAEYFVGANRNNELWDSLSIFAHVNDSPTKEFSFYGNYFTIFSYNLPNVCAPGTGNQTDTVSNGQLFRFSAPSDSGGYFDHTQYKLNINSVYVRDDNPNTNNEMTADRDMRGLIGMKVIFQEVALENSRFEAYYISFFIDGDYTTVNMNECKLYNSWQNHIYVWATNELQSKDETPREDYPAAKLNITNSSITKCGGPVIIAQTNYTGETRTDKCGAVVNIDENTEIWTFVTGQEAWFKGMGVTSIAQQIQQLGYVLQGTLGTTYIRQEDENGNTSGGTVYMNIIMIQLGVGNSVEEMLGGTADIDGSFTKGGVTYMDMSDKYTSPSIAGGTVGYGNQGVATLIGSYGGQAPVFNTAVGGVGVFDGTQLQTSLTGDATLDAMNKQGLTMGDYIALHMNNMGIVLGYGYSIAMPG